MQLDGTLLKNLEMAVAGARRWRGQPVYPDTIKHWSAVAGIARAKLEKGRVPNATAITFLADQLEDEIERQAPDTTTPAISDRGRSMR
ncbi:MAG: hypothetical protein JOY99_11095 [Sphingomonadaceae bacterium]|nr:hypothetical protein [Sphingomonadaceae bacterium]